MSLSMLRRFAAAGTLAMLLVMATGERPAAASDEGSVKVTLSVAEAEACLLISVDSLDLGTVAFGATVPSDTYTIVSCSNAEQDLTVRGTDAVGGGDDPFTWKLGRNPGVNQFSVDARVTWDGEPEETRRFIASDETMIVARSMPEEVTVWHQVRMPEPRSVGAGETVDFEIAWTAILRD